MPTVLRVGRYRFYFFSNESREPPHIHPPHIHVRAAEDEAKFWLDPVQLVANYGFNGRELTKIQDLVEVHLEVYRHELLEAWHDHLGEEETQDS